jgi:hypothetical protein
MSGMQMVKTGLLVAACFGLLVPGPAVLAWQGEGGTARSDAPAPWLGDVSLHGGGILYGQVVDGQGRPLAMVPVKITQLGGGEGTTRTNASGWFQAGSLAGGTYQIVAGRGAGVYRLWTPGTAPPTAAPAVLVVEDGTRILGQRPISGPVGYWMKNPWIVAGVVAVAVAVPVAIHNTQADRAEEPVSP